ncbi:MAG: hypothetical protein RR483_06005, partial [Clostridia bacterium]
MLKSLKSLAALILCLSMAISFTSCYGDTNEWTVEINGEKISSGVYLGYLVNAYSAATTELSSKEGYTENKIFEMTIEEKSVEQWIKDKALESCKLYVATNKMFDEYKCEINPEHETFHNGRHPYMEGHHLIPMSQQDFYTFSLDVPPNIISLCPT